MGALVSLDCITDIATVSNALGRYPYWYVYLRLCYRSQITHRKSFAIFQSDSSLSGVSAECARTQQMYVNSDKNFEIQTISGFSA